MTNKKHHKLIEAIVKSQPGITLTQLQRKVKQQIPNIRNRSSMPAPTEEEL